MADDIRELNALIADYGREFQSPDPRRSPSLGSARLYNKDYEPATGSQQAEMLLSMLPGVGEGLDAAHFAKDIGDGNYGQAGLSGLSMVLPGVGAATIKKIGKEGLSGIFYRGSSNLDELAGKYSLPKEGVLGGGGVYVTQKPEYASNYAANTALGEPKTGGFVAPLNVKFDTPLIIDIKAQEKAAPELKVLKALGLSDDKADDMLERAYEETGGLTNQISSRAKKQGFDGIVLRNEDGTIQEAISYNPKNIRSAFEEVVDQGKAGGVKEATLKKVGKSVELREGPPIKIGDTMQPSLLTSDGETPEVLYRIVSRKEFDKAQESGKFTPSNFYGRIHASSSPDMRYKNAPDDVVIEIKYDPDDGWYSKQSSDKVYGVTKKDIPISRTSKIKQFKKGGSVVERPNNYEPKAI